MGTKKMLTGNYAAAHGARLARIEVMPVYPITPQTPLMEKVVDFIESGDLDAEFIPVESEHSVMAAAVAAQAMGARTFTATSAQGLVYMHENLFVASATRLPVVMAIVNRYVGPPQTIVPDHTDSLDQRDTGWIQIYVEDAQEAHDMIVQAYRIGEDKRVLLPVAVCYEGIIISHKMEPVEVLDQEKVDRFLPPYRPDHVILDPEHPMALGQIAMDDSYITEIKYQQQEAMEQARVVIQEVDQEFGGIFERRYGGLISLEMIEDAEIAILTMGSMATTARGVVKQLRDERGIPLGLVKLRSFRPFPDKELKECLSKLKAIAVLEKDVSVGAGGIVYFELCHCFNERNNNPLLIDYILGLGGRDVVPEDIRAIAMNLYEERNVESITDPIRWYQLRGLS